MGGEGQGHLAYVKYTWSIGKCVTMCSIPAPSSCRSLVAFNLNPFSTKPIFGTIPFFFFFFFFRNFIASYFSFYAREINLE